MSLLSVSDVASQLGVRPRLISDLFYRGELRNDVCPVVSGRRVVPEDYVPQIAAALRRCGHLPRAKREAQA